MRFAFIDSEKAAYPLRLLCRVLQVSKSGYYAWLRRGPSDRALEDEQLRPKVVEAFGRGRGTYGSVRVRREIVAQGFEIGRRRVARLMGEMGLAGLPARKFQVTTDSNHAQPIAANVLNRDFVATRPNKKWVTDITYVWTGEGWLYLAAVLDLYSRRVVGWSTGATLETTLCLKALSTALGHRGKVRGLLHHSDRGTQLGFKGSLQHLERGELRWGQASVGDQIVRSALGCVHLAGRRPADANIDSSSGLESVEAYRARTRPLRPVCPLLSEPVGSARVAGWHRSLYVPSRGATSRSSSAKRSLFFMPAVAECARLLFN